jgi:hypothetical protein
VATPMPSASCRNAVNGRAAPGNVRSTKAPNTPMMLTFPVTASTIVWSHSRSALQLGGWLLARRLLGRVFCHALRVSGLPRNSTGRTFTRDSPLPERLR